MEVITRHIHENWHWRRATVALFAVLLAMLITASTARATALSPTYWDDQPSGTVMPSYEGWGWVANNTYGCTSNLGRPCPLNDATNRFTAYRWGGYIWTQTSRVGSSQIYIYPYSGGWRWTWSSDRGWLAMRASDVRIPQKIFAV